MIIAGTRLQRLYAILDQEEINIPSSELSYRLPDQSPGGLQPALEALEGTEECDPMAGLDAAGADSHPNCSGHWGVRLPLEHS